MTLSEYLESCLSEWPDEIQLEGAYNIINDLYFFPHLIAVHDVLQDEVGNDYLKGVVVYEIFRYYFGELKKQFLNRDFSPVKKSEIDRVQLERNVVKEVYHINDAELSGLFSQFE